MSFSSSDCRRAQLLAVALMFTWSGTASADDREQQLQSTFETSIRGLLQSHCFECHDAKLSEADIDLEAMREWPAVKRSSTTLQRILEQLHSKNMPPPDAKQLSEDEYRQLSDWVSDSLAWEAERHADDPGPVILRRLNNAEYTYTLRDLTGLRNLEPAKEFPADSAAGEGFSNSGAALVMSPAMIQKYLDAGKDLASHAVLLPDGIRFEASPSSSDMTNQSLDAIRNFYAKYTDSQGGEQVNLQGIIFETNQGGRLPVERYIAGTLEARDRLAASSANSTSRDASNVEAIVAQVASARNLNPKYLGDLWHQFASSESENSAQGLMESLRQRWRTTALADADQLSAEILSWQRSLWRFTTIGHIGKVNGPKAWQEAVDPIREVQDIRFPIPSPAGNSDVIFYLQVADAGDGATGDLAILERPRLVSPGRPEILMKDLGGLIRTMDAKQNQWTAHVDEVLMALVPLLDSPQGQDWDAIAQAKGLEPELLRAWGQYLGVDSRDGSRLDLRTRLTQKSENLSGYESIDGWVAEDALSVVANASDTHVRIPGNMPGKAIGVHPSPSRGVGIAWRAPERMQVACVARVRHAHTECGNGVAWRLELRRGNLRQILASGFSNGAQDVPVGPIDALRVREGEELVLIIEPRDGNHSCDLTNIDFEIRSESETWNLAADVSGNILAGNPHADARGRPDVWDFFSEPVATSNATGMVIPSGSLLSQWFNASNSQTRNELGKAIEQLLMRKAEGVAADSPDAILYNQIVSTSGPFFAAALSAIPTSNPAATEDANAGLYGIEPELFGVAQNGVAIPETDCLVQAPKVLAIRIPANLAAGSEFVATGKLHATAGQDGSVQISVSAEAPKEDGVAIPKTTEAIEDANWAVPSRRVLIASPILVTPQSQAEQRIRTGFNAFRQWFPIALCYPKIVPVDEVVTLTLFHREDEPLQRLMLSDNQRDELDRLWRELHFVSQDALKLVDAYEQLWQYATQDADPSAFEPLRTPILLKAEEFRKQLAAAEAYHLRDAIRFAEKAFRGSMTDAREESLRTLYATLRREELPHADAIRFVLARILVAPEFLYRTESPDDGALATDVSSIELANRLSYFLWSSAPDTELMQAALNGSLVEDAVLEAQVQRMLRDPKTERMAIEFGCMWLHIRDLDQLDEKSDAHFPEFKNIRGDLYRESILWISDLIRNDGSVADFLDADHTFLNESLAKYYGIPNVSGPEWRRVDGIRAYGRGGILGLGATLAKQSGASRTSPILRGTWLSEVVLGEKLPKPPKNVPVLSETPPEGMTERQLIERHSNDPACAKCHVRIDPFGFALEGFDAIGRLRTQDSLGLPINTQTILPDGTPVSGMDDMRSYLSEQRQEDFFKQFNRKLLGYALGRSVQLSDGPLLARIRQQQKQNGSKLSDTMVQIVLSPAFRQIRGRDHSDESLSGE